MLTANAAFKFAFPAVEMPYESYEGIHARCRYFVRVTISRSGYSVSNIVKDIEFAAQNVLAVRVALGAFLGDGRAPNAQCTGTPATHTTVQQPAEADTSVKLEVGIEDCLHIEFEYDRTRFHLADVITGRVHFMLVRIKIKYMELAVIRRESAGAPGSTTTENETLTRFEVMDGCPVRDEVIPLRLYLSGVEELTPTYTAVAGAFSVRYFVNLVLVDEEDRRYFKQQEIVLWRKDLK